MKAAVVTLLLSAVCLTGCATRTVRPCPVPKAPPIQAAVPAEQPAVIPAPQAVEPAPLPPVEAAPAPVAPPVNYAELFDKNMNDVYFGFDKSVILGESQSVLASDVAFLQSNPKILFSITSSCDVVGSDAYNDGLGQRRLAAVSSALVAAGIDATRFNGASLGKTSSYCNAKSCQQLNRRVHFAFSGVR